MERMLNRKLARGERPDHINHDSLDNRRSNLRLASVLENNRNARCVSSKKLSHFKGVTKNRSGWMARIRVNGKLNGLGTFHSEEEAAKAYDRAAREYFGSFCVLNFSTEV